MIEERYVWDEASYAAVAAAGLRWPSVLEALHASPRIRTHIGSVLRVVARCPAEGWLVVALIEHGDDEYLIVGARKLTGPECAAANAALKRGGR